MLKRYYPLSLQTFIWFKWNKKHIFFLFFIIFYDLKVYICHISLIFLFFHSFFLMFSFSFLYLIIINFNGFVFNLIYFPVTVVFFIFGFARYALTNYIVCIINFSYSFWFTFLIFNLFYTAVEICFLFFFTLLRK